MEALLALTPIISIAAIMTLLARLPRARFIAGAVVVTFALLGFALVRPELATFYAGPKLASGYLSWVFPAAALALFVVLSVWRRFNQPGVLAFFACIPFSGIVHFLGAWSS